ncbi:MAG: hypothetical protein ACR2J6_07185 [Thermoleophilaceae bacterium]
MSAREWVFGYASLVADHAGAGAVAAELSGYRRAWGVATDNTRAIPGYKLYLSRADGSPPAVFVAFLDLKSDDEAVVNGLARPVEAGELAALDRRERNYDRVEVTGAVRGLGGRVGALDGEAGAVDGGAGGLDGRVWAYMGSAEGRARMRGGLADGTVVVSRDYLEKVRAGLGPFPDADPLPDGLPVWDLDRVDLPA